MLLIPAFQFGFGLLTTVVFCTAAAVAAGRAPRHLLWLGFIAVSSCCATASGAVNLLFLNGMQHGRTVSDSHGILAAQGILSGLSGLLLLAGAVSLLIFLLSERPNATLSSQPWQNR